MLQFLPFPEWLAHPPGWIIAVLVALLVAHMVNLVLDVLNKAKDNTIEAVELVVTLGILIALFHQAYELTIKGPGAVEWYDHPLVFVVLLIFFGLMSVILLIIHKLFSS
jgi:hypothetical protein